MPTDKRLDRVVVDTNVFVAAGFSRRSSSARILDKIRQGQLRMVWDDSTRAEIEHILNKIPPLSWSEFLPLFHEKDRLQHDTCVDQYQYVPDPDDRKFAALADWAGAVLLTNDSDLLDHRQEGNTAIMTPSEYRRRYWPDEKNASH